jgi:EmrB/QacA subfamily drug resistance transporter
LETAPRPLRKGLLALCAAQLMMLLDATIVNVALPAIRTDLGFSEAGIAWAINAYLVGTGGFLILGGRLGDLWGKRRMLVIGLAAFIIASLACAMAPNATTFVIARFIQGVSGAFATSVILGILVVLFPDARGRTEALSLYGFVVSAGAAVGLLVGGMLTSGFDWRWAFLVNLPIGVAVIIAARSYLPEDKPVSPNLLPDMKSAALLAIGMMALTCFILEGPIWGWRSPATLATTTFAISMLAGFILNEIRTSDPLIPKRILRYKSLISINLIQLLLSGSMFSIFFFVGISLQDQRGFDAWEIGISFVPASIIMALSALFCSTWFISKIQPAGTLFIGLCSVASSLLYLSIIPANGPFFAHILPPLLLYGLGGGLCFPALSALALSGIESDHTGAVSGLLNTCYQIGGALGLALLSTVAAHVTATTLRADMPLLLAMHMGHSEAYRIAFIAVVSAILILLVDLFFKRANAP